jgi:hypothetical protein
VEGGGGGDGGEWMALVAVQQSGEQKETLGQESECHPILMMM